MDKNTSDLLNVLSQAGPAPRPVSLGIVTTLFFLSAVAVCAAVFGLRPEIMALSPDLFFWRKLMWISVGFLLSVMLLRIVSVPLMANGRFSFYAAAFAFLSVLLLGAEMYMQGLSGVLNSFSAMHFWRCLSFVVGYGALGIVILCWHMRHFAPTDLPCASRVVGLVAGLAAGLAYALHCPMDGAFYVLLAYAVPVAVLSMLAGKFLPRFLGW